MIKEVLENLNWQSMAKSPGISRNVFMDGWTEVMLQLI